MSTAAGGRGGSRKAVNKASVPWLKNHASSKTYASQLDEEVDAFDAFTSLSQQELEDRNALVAAVSDCAGETGAAAVLSGLAAVGIQLPQSDVLIDVDGADLPALAAALEAKGISVEDAHAPVLRVRDTVAGVSGQVVARTSTPGLVRALQRKHHMMPTIGKVVKIVAQVLKQSNLLGETGGVSEFAVVVMVAAALSTLRQHQDDGHSRQAKRGAGAEALCEVLSYYAHKFDPSASVVTADGIVPRDGQPGTGLWVCSPVGPGVNLAAQCTRFTQAREVMKYCGTMLSKWDNPGHGGRRRPYTYKGKSPLSSIVAFKRVDPQQPAAKAEAKPLLAVPPRSPGSPAGPPDAELATLTEKVLGMYGATAPPPLLDSASDRSDSPEPPPQPAVQAPPQRSDRPQATLESMVWMQYQYQQQMLLQQQLQQRMLLQRLQMQPDAAYADPWAKQAGHAVL